MSTEKKNGGPIFPTEWGQDGLTIRDWFAGQIIGHLYTAVISEQQVAWFDELSGQAYQIADSMLAAREA